jgi:hypothetical protein
MSAPLHAEMAQLLYQYRDDLKYPPPTDSKERRLEAIDAMLTKLVTRHCNDCDFSTSDPDVTVCPHDKGCVG